MSLSVQVQGDGRKQEFVEGRKYNYVKCRIPQRLSPQRSPPQTRVAEKSRVAAVEDKSIIKSEVAPTNNNFNNYPKCPPKSPVVRMRHIELRPKSASNRKDDPQLQPFKQINFLNKNCRVADKGKLCNYIPPKKPSLVLKKTEIISHNTMPGKVNRPVVAVNLTQKPTFIAKRQLKNADDDLPDQDTIRKCEDLEIQRQCNDITKIVQELKEGGPINLNNDKVKQLRDTWQDNVEMFERMKSDLNERQKTLIDLYVTMQHVQQIMAAKGQSIDLPPADEVKFMNVANMTPEHLLQLCVLQNKIEKTESPTGKNTPIDLNSLHNMPNKLIATCERTLLKRKEIIDWFENLKAEEKGISMSKLSKKINEFNAENEMLSCLLQSDKNEIYKDLSNIIEYLRANMTDTMALQLRSEELTYEIMELNSKNSDLKKQMHNSEHLKSSNLRHTIEELEKDLKEERTKKTLIQNRLNRAEGQVKIGADALKQANNQNCNLELALQQMQDQNNTLQVGFEKEITNLSESIAENTVHLNEIAEAREKLQTEKDILENRLSELSENYNDSLQLLKEELNLNIAKVTDTEQKFVEEKEERMKLESKLNQLCEQLLDAELRYKELLNQLEEKDSEITKLRTQQSEFETAKQELSNARKEIEDYRDKLEKQAETLREIELKYQDNLKTEADLRHELVLKEDILKEKENKLELLTQQLQESEFKMTSYEEQLMDLKSHIADLQQEFGEFQDIHELHDMVNLQRTKLLEAMRQNEELAEALQAKDAELERHIENLNEMEQVIEQKEAIIKMISQKDEEQTKIIQLLRQNLEMRTKTENDFNQQLIDKDSVLDTYGAEIETKNQKMTQLEMIILTLEEQLRKVNLLRNRDLEKINVLEKKIDDYETYQMEAKLNVESPVDNLDNLIKILENELRSPFDNHMEPIYKKKLDDAKKDYYKHDKIELHEGHPTGHEKIPTKIVMGNFVKKTYITNEDCADNLGRKKAITNMTQRTIHPNIVTEKWVPDAELVYTSPSVKNDLAGLRCIVPMPQNRNLPFLTPGHYRDEKKSKMFKLAGHKM